MSRDHEIFASFDAASLVSCATEFVSSAGKAVKELNRLAEKTIDLAGLATGLKSENATPAMAAARQTTVGSSMPAQETGIA